MKILVGSIFEIISMSNNHSVTICSVYHSEQNKKLLELNYDLTRLLNPNTELHWIAADNTLPGAVERIDEKKFVLMPGIRKEEMPPLDIPATIGSFHHAMAINKQLAGIKSKFVLILDSDFYILRPNWIHEILAYMQEHNLAFLGSTWHPKYYSKYRYFPSVHCFFVDLDKVSADKLDFRPDPEPKHKGKSKKIRLPWVAERALQAVSMRDRRFIGDSRDTGWRVYREFSGRADLGRECVQPVFKPELHFGAFANMVYIPNRIIEFFLPDRLCFIPKRSNYYSSMSFGEMGYADAMGKGWEEFVWQGKPFGVHLRGTRSKIGYRGGDFNDELGQIRATLEGIADSLR